MFETNVFVLDRDVNTRSTVSFMSTDKGPCKMFLLNKLDIESKNIPSMYNFWTTSKDKNVKIYTGTKKEFFLFEFKFVFLFLEKKWDYFFSETSAKEWRDIVLYGSAYVVEIPANSSFFINMKNIKFV